MQDRPSKANLDKNIKSLHVHERNTQMMISMHIHLE